MNLPALRFGTLYQSRTRKPICALGSKEQLGTLGLVEDPLIARDCQNRGLPKKGRLALAAIPVRRRIEMCARVAEIFETETVEIDGCPQTIDDYTALVAKTSGLPHTLVRANTKRIADALRSAGPNVEGLTRGLPLDILDTGIGQQGGATVRLVPRVDAVGVCLPNNSPGVNVVWILAPVLGIPVLIRPGSDEPFTPLRLILAFIKAGFPAEAFGYYPCGHKGADRIPLLTTAAIVFGSDDTVRKWKSYPFVQVHGTGYSKVIIGEDRIEEWRELVPELVRNMAANSGRSCFKASRFIVPRYAREIGEAVARELVKIRPLPLDHQDAALSAIAMVSRVPYVNGTIEKGLAEGGAEDITAKFRTGPRLETFEGRSYLLPTLVLCDSNRHTLARQEFLFPFAAIVEASNDEAFDEMGETLSLAVYTNDESLKRRARMSHARLVTINAGTWNLDRRQPHEEDLFYTLFQRLSYIEN